MASSDTPLMKQYLEVKSRYKDALLFFRLGDFYELFLDDAKTASALLEITLTTRNKNDPDPIPMCGVPFHSATNYINKLVSNGYKVAICEQMENPADTKGTEKGIVKRDVVRVVSPGTQLDPDALHSKSSNYTHAATLMPGGKIAWATCDYTTGTFFFGISTTHEHWLNTIQSQSIAEALFADNENGETLYHMFKAHLPQTFAQYTPDFYFDTNYANDRIAEQFETKSLDAIHLNLKNNIAPVGALIKYFQESQKAQRIPNLIKLTLWGSSNRMELDPATIRALELLPNNSLSNLQKKDVSLLSWLDHTKTAMGGRQLKDFITSPLTDKVEIESRLNEVEALIKHNQFELLTSPLSEIYDLERLSSRISMGMSNARDLKAAATSILNAKNLQPAIASIPTLNSLLQTSLTTALLDFAEFTLKAIVDQPPLTVREGGMFNRQISPELDEFIELTTNGEAWLAQFEAREKQATGINSLKVRFNRVFGYYIEITKTNLSSVPSHYIRKQTTVGGERFITEELKTFEEKILTAEKKRNDLEYALFRELCVNFSTLQKETSLLSKAIAHIDVIAGFAKIAVLDHCTRPLLSDDSNLIIEDGWHPTVSRLSKSISGINFIANSVTLNDKDNFMLITGPNMGGKSTVMRQTAIITILSQIGAFVPAKKAHIGLVDRVFTRIGSSDNIAEGASTFMVEMSEMSYILRNATNRSFILLDEIGRGTSTFDGMSLAMSLATDIANRIGARTMFATHYHELTELSKTYQNISNHRMGVSLEKNKSGKQIVKFLYKLENGSAERSYGILVARLAGLPEHILKSAGKILQMLEESPKEGSSSKVLSNQLDLFALHSFSDRDKETVDHSIDHANNELKDWLSNIDLNSLTPLQAMNELSRMKEHFKGSAHV